MLTLKYASCQVHRCLTGKNKNIWQQLNELPLFFIVLITLDRFNRRVRAHKLPHNLTSPHMKRAVCGKKWNEKPLLIELQQLFPKKIYTKLKYIWGFIIHIIRVFMVFMVFMLSLSILKVVCRKVQTWNRRKPWCA